MHIAHAVIFEFICFLEYTKATLLPQQFRSRLPTMEVYWTLDCARRDIANVVQNQWKTAFPQCHDRADRAARNGKQMHNLNSNITPLWTTRFSIKTRTCRRKRRKILSWLWFCSNSNAETWDFVAEYWKL